MTAHQRIPVEAVARTGATGDWPLRFAAVGAVALYLYTLCWPTVPPDMRLYLFPWYQHILDHGPLGAFAEPFSNYTPPYLYLLAAGSLADGMLAPLTVIKLLSVGGTAFLAFAVACLLKALGADAKPAVAAFILPTVALNAALLGQCDAIWAGACVLAVAALVRRKTIPALIWCGVAIAFKAQAAFIAPFVIGALIGRRAPLWQWAIPVVVCALLFVPATMLGWPAADLALIYVRQAAHFDFPGNLSNAWIFGTELAPDAAKSLYPLGYAAAGVTALAIGVASAHRVRNPRELVLLALLAALALPFLLPKMHERYFFLADVLALALALASRDRMSILIAVAVQLASLLALLGYIYNWPALAMTGALASTTALVLVVRALHHVAAGHDEGDGLQHFDVGQGIA